MFHSGLIIISYLLTLLKSSFIYFHRKQNTITENLLTNLNISMNNVIIKRVQSTNFLGVVIDQHLSWVEHISTISKKNIKESTYSVSASTYSISVSSYCV